jgi:hypothetical protein
MGDVIPMSKFCEARQQVNHRWAECMACGRQWLAYDVKDDECPWCPDKNCGGVGKLIVNVFHPEQR